MKRIIVLSIVIGVLISGCIPYPPTIQFGNWEMFIEKKIQTTRQWKIRDADNSIGE